MDSIVAGSLSGCCSVLVCHPFDVLRVRLQTESSSGATVKSVLSDAVRRHGLSSLYRGFWGPFFAQGLYKSTIFSTNSFVNRHVFTDRKTAWTVFASGCIAGSVNSLVVSPVELLRTRQVVSSQQLSLRAVIKTVSAETGGLRGLWRGILPTVIRDGPGVGFYLLAFEQSKLLLSAGSWEQSKSLPESSSAPPLSLGTRIAAASTAGVAFWLWALPVDSLKTMVEAGSGGKGSGGLFGATVATLRTLAKEGGYWRLLRPWPIAISRGVPSAIVTLTTYDYIMEALDSRKR